MAETDLHAPPYRRAESDIQEGTVVRLGAGQHRQPRLAPAVQHGLPAAGLPLPGAPRNRQRTSARSGRPDGCCCGQYTLSCRTGQASRRHSNTDEILAPTVECRGIPFFICIIEFGGQQRHPESILLCQGLLEQTESGRIIQPSDAIYFEAVCHFANVGFRKGRYAMLWGRLATIPERTHCILRNEQRLLWRKPRRRDRQCGECSVSRLLLC